MGGDKKKTQQAAQTASNTAVQEEKSRANVLEGDLKGINSTVNNNVYNPTTGSNQVAGQAANNLTLTGGYDPTKLDTLRTQSSNAATTGDYDPNQVDKLNTQFDAAGSNTGYGREGYQNFADTGGYDQSQENDFLENAVAPTRAMYSRSQDELNRRMALQGGYSPGFTTSQARVKREENSAIGSANLQGRVALNSSINSNKLAGLGGLATTQSDINSKKLQATTAEAALAGDVAGKKIAGTNQTIGLESSVAAGKQVGAELLQRFNESGISSLNQNDILQLQNRLQSGNVSQADSQLLVQLAAQKKSLYDNIMQGVSAVGGAVGAVATGFNT